MNKKDIGLLEEIKNFFGTGNIIVHENKVHFSIRSIEGLKLIIAHLESYPLVTAKLSDYNLFKQAFTLIQNKEHLNTEGLLKILGIKISLNLGLSNKLQSLFPNVIPVAKPNYIFKGIPYPNWLSGFVSGDGSFYVATYFSKSYKLGKTIILGFEIGLNQRETEVVKGIKKYLLESGETELTSDLVDPNLNSKYINFKNKTNAVHLQIRSLKILTQTIIPFFDQYPIIGQRANDFIFFKQIAELVKNKEHLTEVGFNKILELKSKMNLYD